MCLGDGRLERTFIVIMKGTFVSESDIYERAGTILGAWRSMCPEKQFFGMSPDDFAQRVEPSGEVRKAIADAEAHLQQLYARREKADRITRRAIVRVVNGVKGDPSEGEDSQLLAAMGYLPHTARSSIISLARKSAARAAQKAADADDAADASGKRNEEVNDT